MTQALADFDGPAGKGGQKFSAEEVAAIINATKTPEVKEALTRATNEALERGAYGAPWLWVTNTQGKSEPFFGSDRFHYVYKFLGLPYQDMALLPPPGEKARL